MDRTSLGGCGWCGEAAAADRASPCGAGAGVGVDVGAAPRPSPSACSMLYATRGRAASPGPHHCAYILELACARAPRPRGSSTSRPRTWHRAAHPTVHVAGMRASLARAARAYLRHSALPPGILSLISQGLMAGRSRGMLKGSGRQPEPAVVVVRGLAGRWCHWLAHRQPSCQTRGRLASARRGLAGRTQPKQRQAAAMLNRSEPPHFCYTHTRTHANATVTTGRAPAPRVAMIGWRRHNAACVF